jgi:hypothetical protein
MSLHTKTTKYQLGVRSSVSGPVLNHIAKAAGFGNMNVLMNALLFAFLDNFRQHTRLEDFCEKDLLRPAMDADFFVTLRSMSVESYSLIQRSMAQFVKEHPEDFPFDLNNLMKKPLKDLTPEEAEYLATGIRS